MTMNPYSPEAISDIIAWYEANADRLPQTASLAQGEQAHDVRKLVDYLLNIARHQGQNPTFARNVQYLFDLKTQIENA